MNISAGLSKNILEAEHFPLAKEFHYSFRRSFYLDSNLGKQGNSKSKELQKHFRSELERNGRLVIA